MDRQLWKHCTALQCQDFILSLKLLPEHNGQFQKREEQLACLYRLSNQTWKYYRVKRIPKRDGGFRELRVPEGLLRMVQRNILHHVLDGRTISPYACAYRKGLSLCDNAMPHLRSSQILKLDIRHFYDDILFPSVYRCAFPGELFPPAAATLLTNLCCYQDRLPQGAPTSPAISNLVMKPFDDSMGEWCAVRNISYTRYCDDMTFSGTFCVKEVYGKVRSFLEAMGFYLNSSKTKLLNAGQRQMVTGIVVNEKLQVPRTLRRQIRQELYYCKKFGVVEHLRHQQNKNACVQEPEEFLITLLGRIQFVLQVNPQDLEFMEYRKVCIQFLKSLAGSSQSILSQKELSQDLDYVFNT